MESKLSMNRRGFLSTIGGAALFGGMPAFAQAAGYDQYGGWMGMQFGATGFFRLEKTDRWWFVTPEGHPFLSFGLNHAGIGMMLYPYNKAFWAKEFGVSPDAGNQAFMPGFERKVKADIAAFGFNALGCHTSLHKSMPTFMPYVANMHIMNIAHWKDPDEDNFPDVFTDDFAAHCDRIAKREASPLRDDPYLLGYSFVDGPIFTDREAAVRDTTIYGSARAGSTTFPRKLRNLGETSPGKRVYMETVKQIYDGDITRFNSTYNTNFRSFDALLRAENWKWRADPSNTRESRDNMAFLLKVIDHYQRTAIAAVRKYDANHLIYGDKLNGNVEQPDEILRAYARHYDIFFLQFYGNWHDVNSWVNRITTVTGQPTLLGDGAFAVPYKEMPNPLGPQCIDQETRARHFRETFYQVYARPDFVGWDWCGWMDRWEEVQPMRQHAGFQDPFGEYNQPIAAELKKFSECLYDVATGVYKGE
jgi:hypothetical protein